MSSKSHHKSTSPYAPYPVYCIVKLLEKLSWSHRSAVDTLLSCWVATGELLQQQQGVVLYQGTAVAKDTVPGAAVFYRRMKFQ